MVVKFANESAVPRWTRKLIDDRQDDEPLVDERGNVRVGRTHGDGCGQAEDLDGQESPSSEGC